MTDGELAAALTRRGVAISSEYSVRVRGGFDEAAIEGLLQTQSGSVAAKGEITTVLPAGGEGSNRWLQVEVRGLRPRDLRQIFEGCGLKADRILRTRFGPIAMDRALARGRSRPLTDAEYEALQESAASEATGNRAPRR